MAKKSKRAALLRAQQEAAERKRRLQVSGLVLAAVIVFAALVWWANRPKVVESDLPAGADRTAWGPVDAPVVIEEWSDFA